MDEVFQHPLSSPIQPQVLACRSQLLQVIDALDPQTVHWKCCSWKSSQELSHVLLAKNKGRFLLQQCGTPGHMMAGTPSKTVPEQR